MSDTLSATKIDLWGICKRRYAFRYLLKIEEPFALAAQAGTATHALLEAYYKHNVAIDPKAMWGDYPIGRAATAIAREVGRPDNATAEGKVYGAVEGIEFVAVVDLLTPDTIFDHKTTSSSKWMKTEAKLITDVQRLLYEAIFPDRSRIQWTSFCWKESIAVPVRLTRQGDTELLKVNVLRPAEQILALPKDTDPLSLEPTKRSCGMYPPKGCPHKSKCFPNKEVVAMSSLLNRLRSLADAQENKTEAGAAPVVAVAAVPDSVVRAAVQPTAAAPVVPLATAPAAAAVVPVVTTEVPSATNTPTSDAAPTDVAPMAASVVVPVTEPTEVKRRGRKPGSKNKPKEAVTNTAAASVVPLATAPAAAAEQDEEDKFAELPPGKYIHTLLVDVLPMTKLEVTYASDLLFTANKFVAESAGVEHALLIDFAKGGPMLAVAMHRLIQTLPLEDRQFVAVESKTAEGRHVLNALIAMSVVVLKGSV